MKKIPLLFCCIACLLAGCATRYDITLNNGRKITGVSHPVLDKETGDYRFKDAAGNRLSIKATRVIEIAPHSSKSNQFR
jgi:hypothetical protein